MRFLKSLGAIIGALIFMLIGGVLIILALNLVSPEELTRAINYVYTDQNVKLALLIPGAIFILTGLLSVNANMSKMQTAKTIAFENPEGQVTVSLSAIEDYVKKSVRQLSEVKEMRSSVSASKRGINITCRATIFADSNIPEITERIQSIVKSRVHDMLGVEETINIKVHVTKISSRGKKEQQAHPKEEINQSRRMPFGIAE